MTKDTPAEKQEKADQAKAGKLQDQVQKAADPEDTSDASVIVPRSKAPSGVVIPEGEVSADNPIIVPASTIPGSDGRQSNTIDTANQDPSVRVVYDYPEPEKDEEK